MPYIYDRTEYTYAYEPNSVQVLHCLNEVHDSCYKDNMSSEPLVQVVSCAGVCTQVSISSKYLVSQHGKLGAGVVGTGMGRNAIETGALRGWLKD